MYSYFKKQNKYKLLSYILIFFTSLNYIFFTHRFFQRENGYILGDWLINYEGGFSRRGFLGEVILYLKSFINFDIINLTFVIVITFYLIFIYLLIKLISKSNINFLIALFIFSPTTFLFNFYDPLAIGRKEFLFLLFIVFYLLYNQNKFFIYIGTTFAVLITLTHELFTLLTPFLFIAKYLDTKSLKLKTYLVEIVITFFSSIIFLLIILSPDPNTVETCNHIKQFGLPDTACWAINAMRGKPFQIIGYWSKSFYLKYYSLFLILIFVLIFFNLKKNLDLKNVTIILVMLLSFLPIFLLIFIVNDWGRYFNVYSFLWLIIIISKNTKQMNYSPNFLKIFIIIFFSLSWYMPHCCPERHFSVIKFKPAIYYVYERIDYRLNN